MTVKRITTIILGAIVLLPLFVQAGYAADIAAVKEEESAMSIASPESKRESREKSGRKSSFASTWWADDLKVIPSVSIKESFNDNVYFTTTNRKSDWISIVSPGLELIRKTERIDAGISARFNGIYYIDQHELNSVDQFYRGKLRYALTEKLALGADAGFARDSQATREIDTTGIIFPIAVIRERKNFGLTGDWRINETTAAGMSYSYGKDRYDSVSFTNLESQVVGLNFTNYFNERTQGRVNFGYANYNMADSIEIADNYSGTIGVSRDFSNIWSVQIDTGTVYTHTSIHALPQDITSEGWGPMGQLTVAGKYEMTNLNLTLSRSVMPVSGTTGAANRTSLAFDIRHRFTYELSGYLTASYFINKSDPGQFSTAGIDQKTIQISMGPRYNFDKDMYLMATYTYSRVDYGQTNNTYADQHLVMLTFNIQHTFWE